jgi:hypothetical protein
LCSFIVFDVIFCVQVNNAGTSGVSVDAEGLRALNIDPLIWVHFLLSVLVLFDQISVYYLNADRYLDINFIVYM